MQIRPVIITLSLAAVLVPAGCNGPTKAGIEARQQARERVSSFNAKFTYDQAEQDLRVGQLDRALNGISRAIEQCPDVATYHVLEGRIYIEKDQLEQAMKSFVAAMDLDPDDAEPHYFAGIVLERWSDDARAYEEYAKAFELDDTSVQNLLATAEALINLGELRKSRELVQGNLARFEHNSAMRHLLGEIALLEGDAVTAARLYQEARLLDPDNVALLEELTWVQYDAGLYVECLDSVKNLRGQIEEKRFDLEHLEARCLTMLGRSVDARNIYLQLTRDTPNDSSVWIELGTLAWKLADFKRVAECSVRVIDIAPQRFEGYMLKGLYERQEGRLESAVALFRQSADVSTGTVLPYLLLGRALEENERPEDALAAYSEALKIDPNNNGARSLYDRLERDLRTAQAG